MAVGGGHGRLREGMVGSGDIPGYQQKYHNRGLILMAPLRSKTLKRCAGTPSHYSLFIAH